MSSSCSSNSPMLEVFADGSYSTFATGFYYPTSIEHYNDYLYVANSAGDGSIVKVDKYGNKTTFINTNVSWHGPISLSFDSAGNLYFVIHENGNIYVSDQLGNIKFIGSTSTSLGVTAVSVSPNGTIFVGDQVSAKVYKMDNSGKLSVFASGFSGKNLPITGPAPSAIAFDSNGDMFIGDGPNIWKVTKISDLPEPPVTEPIPEPSTILLLTTGFVSIVTIGIRRKLKSR